MVIGGEKLVRDFLGIVILGALITHIALARKIPYKLQAQCKIDVGQRSELGTIRQALCLTTAVKLVIPLIGDP